MGSDARTRAVSARRARPLSSRSSLLQKAFAIPTDISQEESVAALMRTAKGHFGRIDILVNNAAIMKTVGFEHGGLEEISATDFERVLRVNVVGTWLCIKHAAPIMRERSYGKIVNISSNRALRPPLGRLTGLQYPTSKAAVIALTRECAAELGPHGIRVNAVLPGMTLSDDVISDEAIEGARTSPQTMERPLRRPQLPEDLLGTIAFFASPDSDFITGQILVVDGGAVMY
jgi:3-oxoacyl-[acyl-carrier protein] reductase